jgi:hypothetical protein
MAPAPANIWNVRLANLFLTAVLVVVLVLLLQNAGNQVSIFVADIVHARIAASGGDDMPSRSRLLLRVMAGEPLERWLAPLRVRRIAVASSVRAEHYALIQQLYTLGKIDLPQRRRSLVFVPKSIEAFYGNAAMRPSLGAVAGGCMIAPFLVPAIARTALLKGYPREDCPLRYYGYDFYRREQNVPLHGTGVTSLCRAVRELGFFRVVVVEAIPTGGFAAAAHECKMDF